VAHNVMRNRVAYIEVRRPMGMQGKALRPACEDVEDKLPACHFLEAFDASKSHLEVMIVEVPNAA
jgi:hypothetical protein